MGNTAKAVVFLVFKVDLLYFHKQTLAKAPKTPATARFFGRSLYAALSCISAEIISINTTVAIIAAVAINTINIFSSRLVIYYSFIVSFLTIV